MLTPKERQIILRRVIKATRSDGVAGPFTPSATLRMYAASAAPLSGNVFVDTLCSEVRSYHPHSRVVVSSKNLSAGLSIQKQHVKIQKQPDLKWDKETCIGCVTLHTYVMEPGENWDPRPPKHVDRVRRALTKWMALGMRGLIVDLRKHSGGSFRPGLHALGAHLLHGSPLLRWVRPNGTNGFDELLSYDGDHVVHTDLAKGTTLPVPVHVPLPVPVALLIGPRTSSSGEIIAACLHSKAGMRSFGAPTEGSLSVNEGYDLGFGMELILTTCIVCTTDGVCHTDERLFPDVATDDPVSDAMKWLLLGPCLYS